MKYSVSCVLALVLGSPALAQLPAEAADTDIVIADYRIPDEQFVVTGHGSRERINETGQPIAVIGPTELASIQGPDLTRALERLPGVSFARNGGLGSTTSLFVRGANSEQLLVLIDGVRVEDQAAPSGGFDFANLESGGVNRIELLRGSNSLAWGSAAIGGVLAVTTSLDQGVAASAEYGAHDTVVLDGRAGLNGDAGAIALSGGYTRSDGISAAAAGTEPDPYRQWRLSGRGELRLGDELTLKAAARHSENRVGFDSFLFVDDSEYQTAKLSSGRIALAWDHSGLTLETGLALSDTRRAYFDPSFDTAPNFTTIGRSLRADLTGHAQPADGVTLDFGADSEWTRFSTMFDPRQSARLTSGHAVLGYHAGSLNLSGGIRVDDHDRFGTHASLGGDASLALSGGWRLRAALGQGFKAPTLSQLYGFGGNDKLSPETATSFEAGIEKGDRNSGLHFAATLFRRDSTNLIDFRFPQGYFNLGKARAQGIELEAGAQVGEHLRTRASYTYLEATNRLTGKDLARRPRHALSVSADWTTTLAGLVLGGDLRLVSDSFDNAANTVRIDGHAVATLRASVPVGEHFELYGRVENVTDASYEVASGYGTYGRSAYGGIRVKW